MKRLFLICAALVMAFAVMPNVAMAQDDIEATTLIKKGDKAPDFTVEMVDGEQITLSKLKGKVVVVNFWATWCPPCRQELKVVEKELINRFKGKDFVFLPISRGEAKKTVEAFRKQNGYTFPMGLDPKQTIYKKYASNYIPRNFLIDREGKVVLASIGYDKAEFAHLIETIEKTINNK